MKNYGFIVYLSNKLILEQINSSHLTADKLLLQCIGEIPASGHDVRETRHKRKFGLIIYMYICVYIIYPYI